jgi:hypothetical protein
MPNRGERRHAQLVRYFHGDFDKIYKKTVLKGPHGVEVEPLSYLALYAAGDMPYTRLVPRDALQRRQAQQQALGFDFPVPAMGGRAHRLATRQGRRSSVDPDELNWAFATEETEVHDLPVIFVAWMRTVYGGHEHVSLWYPEMVPGDWALARFKQGVRTCLAGRA